MKRVILHSSGIRHLLCLVTLCIAWTPVYGAAQELVVEGTARWVDRKGNAHPIRFAAVRLWDTISAAQVGATALTDSAGHYEIVIAPPQTRMDLRTTVRTFSAAGRIHTPSGSGLYELASSVRPGVTGTEPVLLDITGTVKDTSNRAFSVLAALEYGRDFVLKVSGLEREQVAVLFPSPTWSAYDKPANLVRIHESDGWDWDVVLHEYGHVVALEMGWSAYLTKLIHGPGWNLSLVHGKGVGVELAWSEGWPTYFSIAAQLRPDLAEAKIPWVADSTYTDTGQGKPTFPLYTQLPDALSRGEDDEATVARILYDLTDVDAGPGYDRVTLDHGQLWALFAGEKPQTLSLAWAALRGQLPHSAQAGIGNVLSAHRTSPALQTPADDAQLRVSPPEFTWISPQTDKAGGLFTLFFYDEDFDLIVKTDPTQKSCYTPNPLEWQKVRLSGGPVYWMVEMRNVGPPETGPYQSGARRLLP